MQEKCQFCCGNVTKKTVSLDLWKKEKLYVFKSVPAKVCEQCGEKYFSSKIYGLIDKLLKGLPKNNISKLTLPLLGKENNSILGVKNGILYSILPYLHQRI